MNVKRFLEKIFHTVVPHYKNGNVPHLLQKKFIIFLFFLVIILFYFNQNNFKIIRGLNLTGAVYPAVLADLTNQDRTLAGVPKLVWNNSLEKAAKLKAEDMIKNGYFAHTSPSGITPWFWLKEIKYNFIYAGENLALDFTESIKVENAWLNSPKHKENVLNSRFTEIGIFALDGFFEGRNTTFVVEFFGKPAEFKVPQADASTGVSGKKQKVVALKPEVAGASIENIKEEESFEIIEETDKFISVQNTNVAGVIALENLNLSSNKIFSTWYMRFVVNPTHTIKIIYYVILGFVILAIILMLSKEYQKHHIKHLTMGVSLIVFIGILLVL